jgi:hypothetical protein
VVNEIPRPELKVSKCGKAFWFGFTMQTQEQFIYEPIIASAPIPSDASRAKTPLCFFSRKRRDSQVMITAELFSGWDFPFQPIKPKTPLVSHAPRHFAVRDNCHFFDLEP